MRTGALAGGPAKAGAIASRKGSATVAPKPRRIARRGMAFRWTNTRFPLPECIRLQGYHILVAAMQFRGQGPATLGIVFDSDIGETIDTALALSMLYGLQSKNEARVIALSVSKPCLKAAACCEAIARFYGGEPSPFVPPLSIGMAETGPAPAETPIIAAVTAKFPGTIKKLNDTADPAALIRNALTGQTDQNAAIVLSGPATNLARVLDLPGAKELIAQKVKLLAIAEPRLD